MALMAGKVMLDIAATAPAAHIILGPTTVISSRWKRFSSTQAVGAVYECRTGTSNSDDSRTVICQEVSKLSVF